MKEGNLIFAFLIEILGIWVIIDSYKMGLKTPSDPGPGLFPFLLGILLSLFALPICYSTLKNLMMGMGATDGKNILIDRGGLKKVAATTFLLIGYFVLLDTLGFFITTYFFSFGLFLIGYPRKWLLVSIISIVIVILSYLIFGTFLQTPFPRGFLNFG